MIPLPVTSELKLRFLKLNTTSGILFHPVRVSKKVKTLKCISCYSASTWPRAMFRHEIYLNIYVLLEFRLMKLENEQLYWKLHVLKYLTCFPKTKVK